MSLPIRPPFRPMQAQQAAELPIGDDWQYEPVWDGIRCICFRDGDDIELQSNSGRLLGNDFPEVVEHIRAIGAKTFVLDGVIVIPARFVVFDLLVTERSTLLVDRMLIERRDRLESFAGRHFTGDSALELSPATRDAQLARTWLANTDGARGGVVAKDLESVYGAAQPCAMQKIRAPGGMDGP